MIKDILKILENDARTTTKQIATMTGLPNTEVDKTIKQAEKDRTILKYKTLINWGKVENGNVWALIDVKVTPQKSVGFDSIAEHICRFGQVRSLYLASGDYDLVILVMGKSEHEVADFVSQKLSSIEGVQGTETHFILKRYKEDGEVLEIEEELKRLPVIL
ncbi:Lrp/AsnC family transcriptional regulator [Chloroflexota bacterium]